jgi:alkylmercury lyase
MMLAPGACRPTLIGVVGMPEPPEPPEVVQDAREVRAAAFRKMIAEGSAVVTDLAPALGMSAERARRGARALVDNGYLVLDGDRVVGVAGLSTVPTRHRMELPEHSWHTWCAYDAIGIPAAVGVDAVAHTSCPHCDRAVVVSITGGRPPAGSPLRGWLPDTSGTNLIRQFCPLANLFCDATHLAAWRRAAACPAGQEASLEDLAARGVDHWGPLL